MSAVLLEVRQLRRALGEGAERLEVLRGIDLRIEAGQVISIVGPSGCGKSTLLYLLGLLDRPDAGEIWLEGARVDNVGEAERTKVRAERLGFVFQFHFLLSEFSAEENLMLPMVKSGLEREAARKKARGLLELVGLGGKVERAGNQLSGGERQRVAVARALANDPQLILADEPTGNLDTANSEALFGKLKELAHGLGRTVLIVTHNRELAAASDRCLEMRDGRFINS